MSKPGPGSPVWSGQAGVPEPTAAEPQSIADDWLLEERYRWWLPIVISLAAMFLFGVVAVGSWWFMEAGRGGGTPIPAATDPPTPPPSPTPPPPSTSGSPGPTGSVTAGSPIVTGLPVPPLVGLPQQTARTVLDQLGIAYRLRFEISDEPVGTVLATDPEAGAPLPSGGQVTLVIARAAPVPDATTDPATAPSGTVTPTAGRVTRPPCRSSRRRPGESIPGDPGRVRGGSARR